MDILKRAADLLQNSAEEFESPDGLSVCVGIDAWNEFFEALDSELERRAASVSMDKFETVLSALKRLLDSCNGFDFDGRPSLAAMNHAEATIAVAEEAQEQENNQADPVAGQCKFSCESKWLPCSVEHHYHVLSCPDEWPGYETRLLYTAPQPSSPPGWKLVPVEPTMEMLNAGVDSGGIGLDYHEAIGRFIVAYSAMLAAVPEQEGGAA